MLLLLTLLMMCFSPSILGQLEESQSGEDIDFDITDFDLDIVRHLNDGRCCTFWCLDFLI